ncbi:MAG: PIG-L family deacetylase [Candidatus Hydrogenedentes bacterium]|nr:PIG-L family deacetylase [Candidatus Hydrogenedentota bacterium]
MNIVCIGAHPDDCECFAGGTAVKWSRLGHRVLFVSMTNGDVGHYAMGGGPLAARRAREARLSAERGGVQALVLGNHDGELASTIEARREVIGIIRRHEADIVLTHRPNDYHPDHRYASILVQDAAFMVTVPNFCPEVPRLERNPVFMYLSDPFTKPARFAPSIAIDVTDVMDQKLDMLDAMESQVYEWLPWLDGHLNDVPHDPVARRKWLAKTWRPFFAKHTALAAPALKKWYGAASAKRTRFAESFEICEYGHQPSDAELARLFPFFSKRKQSRT